MTLSLPHDLLDPAAYPHRPAKVDLLQTHISYIFLAGDLAYKVKKPVTFDFLDFSTLEKRGYFCEQEVLLNRRLAPRIYLGVSPITSEEGCIRVEGAGAPLEYAVKMIRLPQEGMMDVMLDRSEVNQAHMIQIINVLVPFFQYAERGPHIDAFGTLEAIKFNTDENFAETREYRSTALTPDRFKDILSYTEEFYRNRDLFEERIRQGRIRDCHGDLHSANICLASEVIIYDCIEFNHRFRYQDVAADVAFLAMDLDFRGRADLSNFFVKEFARQSNDDQLTTILPFYKCYRAYVRGKVLAFACMQPEQTAEERSRDLRLAKRYFALAHKYTGAYHRPKILVIFGLSGTGKSVLAQALNRELAWPVISSDRVRKELAGLKPTERRVEAFGEGLYSEEITKKTYALMMERAEAFLAEGQSVILDGTFLKSEQRLLVLTLARNVDAEAHFILCQCAEEIVRKRLKAREIDLTEVSDARWEIYCEQKKRFSLDETSTLPHLLVADTSKEAEKLAHELAEEFV
jgi:aminoglycoside phosphotransferase family enzyme/predicted kinase